MSPAMDGQLVCYVHGGNQKSGKAKAQKLIAQHEMLTRVSKIVAYDDLATANARRRLADGSQVERPSRHRTRHIDPLLQPLAPAEPPEPTSQNLAPFLGSVSPYGPSWYLASPSWAGTCERSYIGRGGRAWHRTMELEKRDPKAPLSS